MSRHCWPAQTYQRMTGAASNGARRTGMLPAGFASRRNARSCTCVTIISIRVGACECFGILMRQGGDRRAPVRVRTFACGSVAPFATQLRRC